MLFREEALRARANRELEGIVIARPRLFGYTAGFALLVMCAAVVLFLFAKVSPVQRAAGELRTAAAENGEDRADGVWQAELFASQRVAGWIWNGQLIDLRIKRWHGGPLDQAAIIDSIVPDGTGAVPRLRIIATLQGPANELPEAYLMSGMVVEADIRLGSLSLAQWAFARDKSM